MIVRDEARWLPISLATAQPFVDEIIIVDTGSTDDSVKIAESFGAIILHQPWDHHFSKAKNLALEKASKEWILVLDADEVILPEDFKKLKLLMGTGKADAYKLELRNYVKALEPGSVPCIASEATMGATAYRPIKLARLFKNKGYRYQHRVHEMIEPSVEASKGKLEDANIPVHHYGILTTTNLKHKQRYYAWLVFKQVQEDPKNVRSLFLAGQFKHDQRKLDEAFFYFKKITDIDPKYKNVWFMIAGVLLEMRKTDDAIIAYEQSITNNPDSPNAPQAINNLAVLYANAGRKQDAKTLLVVAMKKFPNDQNIKKNAERFLQ